MLSALISAGANLLGNLFNKSSQEDYNRQQMQIAQQNVAAQKEFAQHGISWKVADAQAAGLHPLAALGAQTTSFSPVSVGGSAPQMDFGSLGQDLGRAAKAMASSDAREAVDQERMRKLELERAGLQNDVLRAELASKLSTQSRGAGQLGPPMPVHGSVPLPRPGPYRQSGFAVSEDELKTKEVSGPGAKKLPLWGVFDLNTYPHRATGQDLENEYGEFGGSALAVPNTITDAIYTGYQHWLPVHRKLQRRYPRWFKD